MDTRKINSDAISCYNQDPLFNLLVLWGYPLYRKESCPTWRQNRVCDAQREIGLCVPPIQLCTLY